MLHGWAGIGIFFQFLADFMPDHWCLMAPDLKGFDDTEWNQQGYWFPDYLADLDIIIHSFAANKMISLVSTV